MLRIDQSGHGHEVSRPSFLLRKAAQLIVGRWRKRDARRALRAAGSTVRIHWTREWGWTKLKQPTVRRQWALLACPPPNPSAGPGPEAGAPKPRQARCVRVHGCLPGFSIAAGSIKRASQSTPSPLSPEPPSPSSSLRASNRGHQRRFFFSSYWEIASNWVPAASQCRSASSRVLRRRKLP